MEHIFSFFSEQVEVGTYSRSLKSFPLPFMGAHTFIYDTLLIRKSLKSSTSLLSSSGMKNCYGIRDFCTALM